MTPKEALNNIKEIFIHNEYGESRGSTYDFGVNLCEIIKQALDELEALKKPPTVEEVCKALSECLAKDVSYGAKQFYYTIKNTECIMFVTETYGDGLWSINEYLPPHLITLIGRFYEGLKE